MAKLTKEQKMKKLWKWFITEYLPWYNKYYGVTKEPIKPDGDPPPPPPPPPPDLP